MAWSHWAGQVDSFEGLSSNLLVGRQVSARKLLRQSPNVICGAVASRLELTNLVTGHGRWAGRGDLPLAISGLMVSV